MLTSLSPEHQNRAIANIPLVEKYALLARLLGHSLKNEVAYNSLSLASHLGRMVPERFQGVIKTRVEQFFDSSNSRQLQYFLEPTAFFISNNMWNKDQIENFLKAVERGSWRRGYSRAEPHAVLQLQQRASTRGMSLERGLP